MRQWTSQITTDWGPFQIKSSESLGAMFSVVSFTNMHNRPNVLSCQPLKCICLFTYSLIKAEKYSKNACMPPIQKIQISALVAFQTDYASIFYHQKYRSPRNTIHEHNLFIYFGHVTIVWVPTQSTFNVSRLPHNRKTTSIHLRNQPCCHKRSARQVIRLSL